MRNYCKKPLDQATRTGTSRTEQELFRREEKRREQSKTEQVCRWEHMNRISRLSVVAVLCLDFTSPRVWAWSGQISLLYFFISAIVPKTRFFHHLSALCKNIFHNTAIFYVFSHCRCCPRLLPPSSRCPLSRRLSTSTILRLNLTA